MIFNKVFKTFLCKNPKKGLVYCFHFVCWASSAPLPAIRLIKSVCVGVCVPAAMHIYAYENFVALYEAMI